MGNFINRFNNKKITKNEAPINKRNSSLRGTPTFFDTSHSPPPPRNDNQKLIKQATEYVIKQQDELNRQLESIKEHKSRILWFLDILNSETLPMKNKAEMAKLLIVCHEKGKSITEVIEWIKLLQEELWKIQN